MTRNLRRTQLDSWDLERVTDRDAEREFDQRWRDTRSAARAIEQRFLAEREAHLRAEYEAAGEEDARRDHELDGAA